MDVVFKMVILCKLLVFSANGKTENYILSKELNDQCYSRHVYFSDITINIISGIVCTQ
jgi:hypothetical protein